MKNKKKILSLIVCLSLLSSCNKSVDPSSSCSITTSTPTTVTPTPEPTPDDSNKIFSTYIDPSSNTIQISLKGEYKESITTVIVPEEIDGIKVTDIAVSSLRGCSNLTYLFIPKTIKSFNGSNDFAGSIFLTNCLKLEKIEVDKDNPYYYTQGNCLLQRKSDEESTLITGWKDIEIPDEVKTIGQFPFQYTNVRNIKLGKNVQSIRFESFRYIYIESFDLNGNENFKLSGNVLYTLRTNTTQDYYWILAAWGKITIPQDLVKLDIYESTNFGGFYSITSVEIPDYVTSIQNTSFYENPYLEDIHFQEGSTRTDYKIIEGSNVIIDSKYRIVCGFNKVIDIPESVKKISATDFYKNAVTEYVVVREGVEEIETLFTDTRSFTNLRNVQIYNNRYETRNGCLIIDKYTDTVIDVYGKTYITEVELPFHVRSINRDALCNLKINKFTFNEGLADLKLGIFKGGSIKEINIPSTLESIEIGSYGTTPFDSITDIQTINVHKDNPKYKAENGMLLNKDTNELLLAYNELDVTTLGDLSNFIFNVAKSKSVVTTKISKNNTGITKNVTFEFMRYTSYLDKTLKLVDMTEEEFKSWEYFDCFVSKTYNPINNPARNTIVFSDNTSKTIQQLIDELE